MIDDPNDAMPAVELMRRALVLLDTAGEHLAALRLQYALDTMEGHPPTTLATLRELP